MKILITGGAGFVGSHLAISLKKQYPSYQITCLDNLKRRGSELNLPRLRMYDVQFMHADIRNAEDLADISVFDVLIDASAEPSVLAGITSPVTQVVNNNFFGTLNCLELAKKHKANFIFLSTSRVYPIQALESANFEELETRFSWTNHQNLAGISQKGVTEDFTLKGSRSFYGTTKLASELLIQEYDALTDMKTVINRCGVLTGAYQMGKIDQGVVVLWMARHFWKGKLGYFGYGGEGKQLRDMLDVADLYTLINKQIHEIDTFRGEIFNVGGGNEISVSLQELTKICQEITGNHIEITKVIENRVADLRIYTTDNQKITDICGWKPKKHPTHILQEIFEWIRANEKDLKPILN
jgi:CDP-paratose 2-epimerase